MHFLPTIAVLTSQTSSPFPGPGPGRFKPNALVAETAEIYPAKTLQKQINIAFQLPQKKTGTNRPGFL
jgi:hypothetical protein